jgi:crotonobetainyl-CoA:carnitine CoA-transferase CaiB-like acyl-CoA transferase
MDITGRSDGPPLPVAVPLLELSCALYGAASIVAAARVRRLHGIGQRIDVTLFDAAVNALSSYLAAHCSGGQATRSGNAHALMAPWGAYPARDGFVVVCTVTNDQFHRLCDVVGQPGMRDDHRFSAPADRRRNAAVLDERIAHWTGPRTVQECVTALSAVGIACGPIAKAMDLPCEPNLAHRGLFVDVLEPISGRRCSVPSSPLRAEPPMASLPPRIPSIGEDREHVLRELQARPSAPPATGTVEDVRPLAGVRVVEIGQYTLAPFACRQLSALGADVIKVEPPQGDAIRNAGAAAGGSSQIFAMMNTDKRGVVLDLGRDADRATLHRLLAGADVLVENMRPGAMASFGLSPELLRDKHPRLVCCSLSGFGAESAYPGRAAFDTVIQAMSGLMDATQEGAVPYKTGMSTADLAGSQFGLLAILAAIEEKEVSGNVPHIDVAMHDATTWLTTAFAARTNPLQSHRVLPCMDGSVLVQGHEDALAKLGDCRKRSRAEAASALERQGLRATAILGVAEVVAHAQTGARGLLVTKVAQDGTTHLVLNSPLRLLATPPRTGRLMSGLGADHEAVLAELP